MFTDGISETMNAARRRMGRRRAGAGGARIAGRPAAETIARIMEAADRFAAGAPQHDDMTLVAMRVAADQPAAPRV